MSSPGSIDDLLGASSGSDFDVDMSDGNPSPPASPEKDAAAPADSLRPAPLQLPDDNQAVNAGIADASSGSGPWLAERRGGAPTCCWAGAVVVGRRRIL